MKEYFYKEEEIQKCPYCGGKIEKFVAKCRHCGEWLDKEEEQSIKDEKVSKFLIGWVLPPMVFYFCGLLTEWMEIGFWPGFVIGAVLYGIVGVIPLVIKYMRANARLNAIYEKTQALEDKDKYDCQIIKKDGKYKFMWFKGPDEQSIRDHVEKELGGKIVWIKKRTP